MNENLENESLKQFAQLYREIHDMPEESGQTFERALTNFLLLARKLVKEGRSDVVISAFNSLSIPESYQSIVEQTENKLNQGLSLIDEISDQLGN